MEATTTPGGDATFYCISVTPIANIQWLVNGSSLENLNLRNVETEFNPPVPVGILNFTKVPLEYNNTRVRCRAELSSGRSSVAMETALLTIQGYSYS